MHSRARHKTFWSVGIVFGEGRGLAEASCFTNAADEITDKSKLENIGSELFLYVLKYVHLT